MTNLAREIEDRFNQCQGLRWSEYRRFLDLGVPSRALVSPELLARAQVVFQTSTPFFDFADEVDREAATTGAFIILARDQLGDPFDLVAWSPRTRQIATWAGSDLPMLGWDRVLIVRPDLGEALSVHPSPLDWLKDNREGVVILKPKRARWYLEGFSLKVSDVEFGRKIRDALQWPPPQIFVEKIGRAAA